MHRTTRPPDTADAVLAHGLTLIEAATPWATGGVMPNFGAGNDLRPGEFRYDPETLTRLQSLSAEHDPSGVLRVGRYLEDSPGAA